MCYSENTIPMWKFTQTRAQQLNQTSCRMLLVCYAMSASLWVEEKCEEFLISCWKFSRSLQNSLHYPFYLFFIAVLYVNFPLNSAKQWNDARIPQLRPSDSQHNIFWNARLSRNQRQSSFQPFYVSLGSTIIKHIFHSLLALSFSLPIPKPIAISIALPSFGWGFAIFPLVSSLCCVGLTRSFYSPFRPSTIQHWATSSSHFARLMILY